MVTFAKKFVDEGFSLPKLDPAEEELYYEQQAQLQAEHQARYDQTLVTLPSETPARPTLPREMSRHGIRLLSIADLRNLPPPQWQIEGLWEENTAVVFYGESGCGKSFLALDWALSVATGREWKGRSVTKRDVVYIYAEGSQNLYKRIAAWNIRNGFPPDAEHDGIRFVVSPVNLLEDGPGGLEELVHVIRSDMDEDPGLIVVDTLARGLNGADENSNPVFSELANRLGAIQRGFECTVMLVHHTGHNGNRARGGSAIKANFDTVISLKQPSDNQPLLVLGFDKSKDASGELKIPLVRAYVEEVDSCTIELRGDVAVPSGPMLLTHDGKRAMLQALGEQPNGATDTEWKNGSVAKGVKPSSFYNWKIELEHAGFVEGGGGRDLPFTVTQLGREACGMGPSVTPNRSLE